MAWIAAAITRMKRVIAAPPIWGAVWIIGTIAGALTDREGLALGCFLIGAPALLLTQFLDMRRYEAPRQEPAGELPDLATRVRLKKERRNREGFTRDCDPTGHTLH